MHLSVVSFILILIVVTMTSKSSEAGMEPGTCSSGSVHDMNTFAYVLNDPLERVCVFCHTPHNAQSNAGPLWNRTAGNAPTVAAEYIWASPANGILPINADPLVGPSRLCMVCHDGTVALDAHGGHMTEHAIIGDGVRDLTNTHPIGFSYDYARIERGPEELADKNEYFSTAISLSSSPGVYNSVDRSGSRRIVDVLYQGSIVTCSSCHDVHNCDNVKPNPGNDYNYLLWAKEEQSLICLSCHIK